MALFFDFSNKLSTFPFYHKLNLFVMQKFNQIKELVNQAQSEAEKFYDKGNKAAGTRLRKAMLEIKNLAHEVRKEVVDMKNQ